MDHTRRPHYIKLQKQLAQMASDFQDLSVEYQKVLDSSSPIKPPALDADTQGDVDRMTHFVDGYYHTGRVTADGKQLVGIYVDAEVLKNAGLRVAIDMEILTAKK